MLKIILPTDFSENAYNALKYAVQLYKDVETTFYLLHTFTPAGFRAESLHTPLDVNLEEQQHLRITAQLVEVQHRLEKEFPNPLHTFETRAAFNTLTDEIESMIETLNANLIVMGTKGVTDVFEVIMGTNATEVMRKASCPLIAIPSGYTYSAPKDIIFATDYEVNYSQYQLQPFLSIAETHQANIDVLHVATPSKMGNEQLRNKQNLVQLLATTPHTLHDMPNQGVIEAINGFKANKPEALLVMIKNKHTFLERLFFEPIIKKIGLQITSPFMVLTHAVS